MDRTEPPDTLPWVDQFMREVQAKYLFHDIISDNFYPIVFSEETSTNDEGEETHYQEVCFKTEDGLQTINDEYVHHKHAEAMKLIEGLPLTPNQKALLSKHELLSPEYLVYKVFAFRHSGDDWGSARTIEETVLVNKLGWGIFRRRDLPEAPNTESEDE